jgi:hypothetical protein
MKRTTAFLLATSIGLTLTGFSPRPYSDLAEYKRLPMEVRIERMQKSGEDLFLRRRFEDAIVVFETILALDEKDLKARLWITKAHSEILREKQDGEKKRLYQKYGHLIPKDMIYDNWHWGPSVGHFEVRYSEPKPYVRPERKLRPKASDAEVKAAKLKAEKSGAAADYFELAMLHWSRREKENALRNYFKAIELDTEMLAKDDELMLATVSSEVQEKVAATKVTASDYLASGKLEMIQGDRVRAVQHLVRAAVMDKQSRTEVSDILSRFVESPQVELVSAPADVFSFRQAYVFDKDSDNIYVRAIMQPKKRGQIVPVDLTIPASIVEKIDIQSKDAILALGKPGISDFLRIWLVLPEKEGEFPEYEVRLAISINRKSADYLELSNFSLPKEQPDNWSFVIGSEFNFGESFNKGEFEKSLTGIRIFGYHLAASDGKGPVLPLAEFKQPLPRQIDIWKIIENGGETTF